MAPPPLPQPLSLLLTLSLLITSSTSSTTTTNLTAVLSPHPSLSSFSSLLTTVSLSSVQIQTPFSLLAVPNLLFPPPFPPSSTSLSDLLRHHLILSPFPTSLSDLPLSLPTLLASTGRYPPSSSSVTLSLVHHRNLTLDGSANVVSVFSSPDVTVVVIDSFLVPVIPADPALSITGDNNNNNNNNNNELLSPPVNITKALANSHGFNVFASILSASGLVDEFHRDESGAGLTIFIPTDAAFANIPSTDDFQSLTAEQKAVVLRFHCIRSYYPLGSLQAIVNPLQPTLATEIMGAGKYTLNITGVNGSVVLDTGVVQSIVDQTVFDENPVAIFGVPVVFLPKEIFGRDEVVSSKRGKDVVEAPSPVVDNAPHSPVGEVKSMAVGGRSFGLDVVCIALLYLLV